MNRWTRVALAVLVWVFALSLASMYLSGWDGRVRAVWGLAIVVTTAVVMRDTLLAPFARAGSITEQLAACYLGGAIHRLAGWLELGKPPAIEWPALWVLGAVPGTSALLLALLEIVVPLGLIVLIGRRGLASDAIGEPGAEPSARA